MESSLVAGLKERIATAASIHPSVGIVLPSNNYADLTNAVFEFIHEKSSNPWVYVTVTKPFYVIKNQYGSQFKKSNIQFIDCVSRAAGIKLDDPQCFFLDSPSHLEKLILEVVSFVNDHKSAGEPFVVIDSLSSLILYNDELLVTEFFTHLINNLNLVDAHTISLCLEEEMNDMMHKILYLKNDKIIKVRESFI